jgi:hypothetical protein
MLTEQERERTIKRLRAYPAGIPSQCWGTGPLAELDDPDGLVVDDDCPVVTPDDLYDDERNVLRECG